MIDNYASDNKRKFGARYESGGSRESVLLLFSINTSSIKLILLLAPRFFAVVGFLLVYQLVL